MLFVVCLWFSFPANAGTGGENTRPKVDLVAQAKEQVRRVAAAIARCEQETGVLEAEVARKKGEMWFVANRLKGFLAPSDTLDPWDRPWRVVVREGRPIVCSVGAEGIDEKTWICRDIRSSHLGPRAASVSTRLRLSTFAKLRDDWESKGSGEPWTIADLVASSDGTQPLAKDGWGLSWWIEERPDDRVVCSAGPDNFATSGDDQCIEEIGSEQTSGIFIYLALLILLGWLASRRMKDVKDFFAGGKRLGFLAVAFSARATGESGWLLLGLTGMGAAIGAKAFWVVGGEVLGVTIAWLFMSRRFKRLTDRYDSITIPDYLESRFKDTTNVLRLVSAGTLVIFVTIYVSAQIDATGKAFEYFLNWNYFTGALVGFAVVMVYSVSGGFLAVVWSDVFQGTLMFVGLVALPVVGLAVAGGFEPVFSGLAQQDPNLVNPMGTESVDAFAIASILSLALIGLGFLGSPQVFVRFLSLRNEGEIGKGALVAITFTLLTDAGAVLIGMIGRYLMTDSGVDVDTTLGQGGENVLPLLVQELMPAFIVGLYIAVVLSAIMSTVDSLLVVASSAAVRDVYQKVLRPDASDASLVPLCRRGTFILGLFALGIALSVAALSEDRTIFWFVIFGWSGIAATFCPTIILSLFWPRFSRNGALAAMIVGFLAVPLFKFAVPGAFFQELGELPPAFLCSFTAGVVVSLLKPQQAEIQAALREDVEHARRSTNEG